jgi:hypothetical protein
MGGTMSRGIRVFVLSLMCYGGLLISAAKAETPNYVYFFNAGNGAYHAYLDYNNRTTDASGNLVVNVKLDSFSEAYRSMIKQYFPGAENTAYAIYPISVNCSAKTIGGHVLVYYDGNGFPITSHDYGGVMASPVTGAMEFYLMQKVCGF